jgi:hypothetical protein
VNGTLSGLHRVVWRRVNLRAMMLSALKSNRVEIINGRLSCSQHSVLVGDFMKLGGSALWMDFNS